MSYDIDLVNPVTRQVLVCREKHNAVGGTYVVGGTAKCSLNVTYNYADHYYRVFGEDGIRTIYGMTGKDSSVLLIKAINELGTDLSDNYWEPTEGNARWALVDLLGFALEFPDGVWQGD